MLDKVRFHEADVVWSLKSNHPLLWQELVRSYPWIEELNSKLLKGCPGGASLDPFEHDNCVRPINHYRAFYIKHADGPVLAVKGSEVVDPELERAFRQFYSLGRRWPNMETFPLTEQKMGLAVHVTEAVDEAEITARFQEDYLRQFGSLADFPLHLVAYRFPSEVSDQYFRSLGKFASDRNMRQSKLLGQEGLAAYIYFFPHLPLRLAHFVPKEGLGGEIVDASTRESVLRAKHDYDSRQATEMFFSLTGKMLALGYFPLAMESFGIGYCTSAQNVTSKGAMVDAESLYPFERVRTDWEFFTIFLTTLATLCATARVLLYSPLPNVRFEFNDPSIMSVLLGDLVWTRIRREVSACAERGMKIDDRLQRVLEQPSLDKIFDLTKKMHLPREDFFLVGHLAAENNRGWD